MKYVWSSTQVTGSGKGVVPHCYSSHDPCPPSGSSPAHGGKYIVYCKLRSLYSFSDRRTGEAQGKWWLDLHVKAKKASQLRWYLHCVLRDEWDFLKLGRNSTERAGGWRGRVFNRNRACEEKKPCEGYRNNGGTLIPWYLWGHLEKSPLSHAFKLSQKTEKTKQNK